MSEPKQLDGSGREKLSILAHNEPIAATRDRSQRILYSDAGEEFGQTFITNRRLLGQIYEAIDEKIRRAYVDRSLEFPTLFDIMRDLKMRQRELKQESGLPDQKELHRMLLVLATLKEPLIHAIREVQIQDGKFGVITRFVNNAQPDDNLIARAYAASSEKSAATLRVAHKEGLLQTDWEEFHKHIKANQNLVFPFRKERVDVFIKYLLFLDSKESPEVKIYQEIINHQATRWNIKPFLKNLKRQHLIVTLTNAELRAQHKSLARLPDFYFLNDRKQLQKRLMQLCACLNLAPLSNLVGQSVHDAVANTSPEDLPQTLSKMHEPLLAGIQREGRLPAGSLDVIIECLRLSEHLNMQSKKDAIKSEFDEIAEITKQIKKHGSLKELSSAGQLYYPEKYIRLILQGRVPNIIAIGAPAYVYDAHIDLGDYSSIVAIYKHPKIMANAIGRACELFNSLQDSSLLEQLEELLDLHQADEKKLHSFINPPDLLQLRKVVQTSYQKHLNFWQKLILWIKGENVPPELIARVRAARQVKLSQIQQKKAAARKIQARSDAQAQIKLQAHENIQARKKGNNAGKVDEFLDRAWQNGRLPSRQSIRNAEEIGSDLLRERILTGIRQHKSTYAQILEIPVGGELDLLITRSYFKNNRQKLESMSRDEAIPERERRALARFLQMYRG